VVNQLSDSVSVVDVGATPPRVVRTLLVGDEPRDIVFAGPGFSRAFITTARRGQNVPLTVPPMLTTPGTPRALVWVFDATAADTSLTGTPETILELFGDTPRALAASADGSRVYAAVFHSGNQTTALNEGLICDDPNKFDDIVANPCTVFGFSMPGGLPLPERSADGVPRPETGLIVKYDNGSGHWLDQLGRNWDSAVRFSLPDKDVFAIDATANPPLALPDPVASSRTWAPCSSTWRWTPRTPAGSSSPTPRRSTKCASKGPASSRQHGARSPARGADHGARRRQRAAAPSQQASQLPRRAEPARRQRQEPATPTGMAVSSDGATLYVAAFSSAAVGVFATAQLVDDSSSPAPPPPITSASAARPERTRPRRGARRLYVLTRFDNSISVIDTIAAESITCRCTPEPAHVVAGQPFLYDAVFTSSNGERRARAATSSATSTAWPGISAIPTTWCSTTPTVPRDRPDRDRFSRPSPDEGADDDAEPARHGQSRSDALARRPHRRQRPGRRPARRDAGVPQVQRRLRRSARARRPIPPADMAAFAAFALDITYPPNPIRALDNSLTPDEGAGRAKFFGPANPTSSSPATAATGSTPPKATSGATASPASSSSRSS
jgi:hypothetical protein